MRYANWTQWEAEEPGLDLGSLLVSGRSRDFLPNKQERPGQQVSDMLSGCRQEENELGGGRLEDSGPF